VQLDNAPSTLASNQDTIPAVPVAAASVATTANAPLTSARARGRGIALPTWVKLLLGTPLAATGIVVVLIFILAAIFAPLITPNDPTNIGGFDRYLAPSLAHPFGTDYSGIDVFAEVLYGARVSLAVGAVTGIVTTFLSIVIGMTAGYIGGWFDDILGVVMNVFLVIPQLPLLLVFAAYLPIKGPLSIILVISITGWAWGARVLRSQTLSLRNRDFVQAAYMSGESTWRIIFREVLPNMISLTVSSFIFAVIGAIFTESSLEFLSLGDVNAVSWGTILYNAQQFTALQVGAWWNFVFPGLAIAVIVTACVFVNYGIDAISNPRLRVVKAGKAHRQAAKARAAATNAGVAR